jgi:hypothetical protein
MLIDQSFLVDESAICGFARRHIRTQAMFGAAPNTTDMLPDLFF